MGLMQSLANMVMRNQTLTTMIEPNYIQLDRPRAETILHDYSALYSVAYLACEQTQARSLGSLPVAVYRKNGDARERVDHPLADLLEDKKPAKPAKAEKKAEKAEQKT
ncbi:MAG: hypothetical protein J6S63_08475, partial [Atopobiaceae bacterium]|nr:hypothetical protein [Atopobiaceae bacterium]